MSNEISVRRKVTVYNTSAQNNKVLESAATTWGQLQHELGMAGIPFSGMRAVVGETQTELITDQSSLGEGEMTLFLMPRRVKSGTNVDPSSGVSFSAVDWNYNDPTAVIFRTQYDAAMAFLIKSNLCSQRAQLLFSTLDSASIQEVNNDLDDNDDYDENDFDNDYNDDKDEILEPETEVYDGTRERRVPGPYPVDNDWGFELSQPLDPETERLKRQAEELQRRMQ